VLRDPDVTTIVVEHRDRFARFGAQYVDAALSVPARRLIIVDPAEEILTSPCPHLDGRRPGANRPARAVAALGQDTP